MIRREKSRHCQTCLEGRSSLNENLQRKQNWTAKCTNLEENVGKIVEKYPRKTCGYGEPRGHLIRVLNERSVNDG